MTPEKKTISITFHNQEGCESPPMKIVKSEKLFPLFEEYAKSNDLPTESLIFSLYGQRIRGDETPAQIEMNDEDQVDVFMHRHGGSMH